MSPLTAKQLERYMKTTPQGSVRFASVEMRSWWNPLRYILGKFYYKKF